MAGAAPAAAQSTNWTGGGGDSMWGTAGNWSNGVPTAGVVTTIGFGSPSVILGGGLTASSGISTVGNGATLTISSGASLTSSRWDVGQFGDGNMVVTGTGTELIVNADGLVRLLVGNGATGALTITDGAVVNVGNAGSASVAILGNNSGSGSILLSAVGSNRGVLEVFGISRQAGSLTFDGGILRATGGNNNFLSTFSSGSVVINSGGAFIDSNGFNIGISAALAGSGGLTKLGAETLSLTTANSYTGVTTISAGYLNVSDNGALGTTAGGTVVSSGGALQLQNNVTISEALTLNGTGPTGLGALRSISDSNTYAGNITLGSDALITHSSGLGSLSVTGSVSGSFGLTVGGTGTIFISGNITTGTGGLTKEGNSTLVLSGTANTFTGATTINAGILQAGAVDVIASSSTLVLANVTNATFSTSGFNQSVKNLSGGGSTGGNVIATTGTTLTIIQDGGGSTFAGIIGGGGHLAKTGADVLILSGTNGYSGTTSINGGELRLGSTGALSGTSMVTLADTAGAFLSLGGYSATINGLQGGGSTGGGVDLVTGTLTVNQSTNTTYSGEITGAGSVVKAGTGTLTLAGNSDFTGGLAVTGGRVNFNSAAALGDSSGSVMLNGGGLQWATGTSTDISSRLSLGASGGTLDTNGNDVTFGTAFGGSGTLTKQGAGTLTLTAAETYVGGTIISQGILALSGNGSIASSASLLVDGTFDISGIAGAGTSVNNLSGGTTTGVVALGAKTLTVIQQTEFLQLAGGLSGSGTLIKQGGEALTLSGDSSAFSGTIQVNAGTLSITNWGGTTAGHVGGNVSVASGGTLEAAGATIDGSVTIASGGILEWTRNGANIGNIAMGALSMDAGSITRMNLNAPSGASSIISVTGDATVNGTLNLVSTPAYGAGVYRVITTGGTLTDNGMVLGETQPNYMFRIDAQAQSLDVVVTVLDTTVQYWSADGTTRGGGGNWTSGNSWLGANGGYAAWAGGTAVFDGPFGIVMVDGTQSFDTIEFLTSGYALQAGISGQLNLGAGGRLWAEGEDIVVTVSAPIIGTGALTKIGEGTIVLSGTNTYQGGTIIQAGTLEISSDANLGDAAGSITFAGGELEATATFTSARDVVLNAQAIISVEETFSLTLTGTISGTAGLTFGGGTLVLTGTNTYQGATIIGGGTLFLTGTGSIAASSGVEANGVFDISGTTSGASIVSLSGTGSVALGAQTLTITNGSGAFSGTIGGTGGITVSGGTQTLSGVNGFTGETRIQSGTLALAGTGSIAASSGVVADGTFDISGVSGGGTSVQNLSGTGSVVLGANVLTLTAAAGGFQGGISGTGGLTLMGPGTFILSGENTYTGNTTIAAGTLQVGTGGAQGSLQGNVVNNGTLVFDRSGTIIFAGDISGSGTLAHVGSGTLILTGASSYAGGTNVTTGTLVLSASTAAGTGAISMADGTTLGLADSLSVANDLTLGGTVTFDLAAGSATLSGVLSGTGAIAFGGGGRISLTGDSSAFTGATVVSGTLAVNGVLGGSVTVENGGTLKGSGTVGPTTVAAGGTVAPGNSIGTLTVAGPLTFAAGSTYAVEIDTTGASDLILVTGTATLGGATVAVTKAAGAYLPGTHYTILSAQGGIIGSFNGPVQDMPFVDLLLSYDTQNAYLDVARNATPFPSVAVTANQRATAGAVQALGEGNAVYNAVVSQASLADAQQAFNTLDGEIYPSALSVLQQESLILRRAVLDRARVPASGPARAPLAYAAGSAGGADVVGMADSPNAFWAQAFGAWSRIDGNGNAASMSGDTAGVIVGYDRTFAGNGADWRLGFAAGYSSSAYQVDARSSSFSSDNSHVALYGGTSMGAVGVRLGGAFSWADISASRTVAFPGFLNALDADTSARTGQVFGEVGYALSFASTQVEPFVGLAYVNVDMNGFTEQGGPSALTAAGSSAGVTYSTLGARFSVPFSLGSLPAAFNGTLAWQHAFGDSSPDTLLAFTTGALPFSISGVPIASDAALVEAGLDLTVMHNAALSVFYAGQLSQSETSNMVKGRFTLNF